MESVKCARCGLINRLADESCERCGAELSGATELSGGLKTEQPNSASYYTTSAYQASQSAYAPPDATTNSGPDLSPPIGSFDSVGAVVSPTIKILTGNFWLITKIIFAVFAPYEILKAWSFNGRAVTFQDTLQTSVLALACKALVAPALIYALITVMRTGVAPTVAEAYRWGVSRLGKFIICALMAWVLIVLGYICLIIPGFLLSLAFVVVYPMAVLEEGSPTEILKRSYHLTKGYRGEIFLVTLIVGLLTAVISVPAGILQVMLVAGNVNFWPLNAALGIITDVVSESTTVLSLVIYLSLNNRAGFQRRSEFSR